jgi:UDP-glucose:(heptosyl)LPS alpha-1,3-glucosyltransferase
VYYAADVCFAHKAYTERNFFYRLTPRCRHYLAFENAVFGTRSKTQVLMIAKAQIPIFQRYYHTSDSRLQLLAPGIRRECIMPPDYAEQRQQKRVQLGLDSSDLSILFVGSDYRRKGLDRALRGIAALEEPLRQRVYLTIVGQDKQTPYLNLARTLGLENNVSFLGARDDIPQLMWSADLLLHPAYSEAAGLVLLEAMVAGLPVIASSVCGYAHFIADYQMGRVLSGPLSPPEIADAIATVFTEESVVWHERSCTMTQQADIFSMPVRAAEIIERIGLEKLGNAA